MYCVKLPGQSLMARDFDRQVAELQIRAAVLNGYTALGIPVTEPVGLGHVDKWRTQRRIDVMSMKPRKLSAVLSILGISPRSGRCCKT